MKQTTVYLPDDQADRLKEAARRTGRSEAEILRSGLERELSLSSGPLGEREWPSLSLGGNLASRHHEALEGFGGDSR